MASGQVVGWLCTIVVDRIVTTGMCNNVCFFKNKLITVLRTIHTRGCGVVESLLLILIIPWW